MIRLHLLDYNPAVLPADLWDSLDCELLVIKSWSEKMPGEAKWLQNNLPSLPGHIWFASSGTLASHGQSKWIAISKAAILASANAVNQHLNISKNDSWGLTLPLAHVGGLGILARAHLLNQKVHLLRSTNWAPESVSAANWNGHWLSLVPTQVFDLVQNQIIPPKCLKGAIVGGDRLSTALLSDAIKLGWPILPSYGLTECASQVATAKTIGGKLEMLPHINAKIEQNKLSISSSSLFTGVAMVQNSIINFEKRTCEWWTTQDIATIDSNSLSIIGRQDNVVKVRGEKVDLIELEETIGARFGIICIVVALEDGRDGHRLIGVSETSAELNIINKNLLSHQKLIEWKAYNSLPRSPLGKIKRGEIKEIIMSELKK